MTQSETLTASEAFMQAEAADRGYEGEEAQAWIEAQEDLAYELRAGK